MSWNHIAPEAIATNKDPILGGIVDKNIVSGLWFAIPNSDHIEMAEGFKTKQEAIAYIEEQASKVYILD